MTEVHNRGEPRSGQFRRDFWVEIDVEEVSRITETIN